MPSHDSEAPSIAKPGAEGKSWPTSAKTAAGHTVENIVASLTVPGG